MQRAGGRDDDLDPDHRVSGRGLIRHDQGGPKETEVNVYLIGDVKKYIRLNVKPNGSKGSGGGAAATAIQEAAQCVYAAMRYYCGDKEIYTEEDLK